MFQIKICGVTRPEDAACAAEAGADAIGLNFFSKSSRFVELETATEIAQAAPAGMAIAGVFVDAPAEFIARVAESVQLDWIQLHGDEPAALVADLPKSAQILRAWRVRDGFVDAIAAYWEASEQAGRAPDALLLDAYSPSEAGGTGQTFDWRAAHQLGDVARGAPVVLAGGLTPDNVADAIRTTHPVVCAVDVASGVESAPGVKDRAKIGRFAAAARAAFQEFRAE